MKKPIISLVAAIGKNREIGLNGKMLWQIPEDLEHFRKLIDGHCIIIGRKTFRSIGKIFTDRKKIVVLSGGGYVARDCIMASSLDDAIIKAHKLEKEEIFICGGGSVYVQTINMADKLYLTVVKKDFEADTFFPEYSEFKKVVSQRESRDKNFEYTFLELEK